MRVTARSQTLEQVFKTVLVIIIVEIVYKMTNGNTVGWQPQQMLQQHCQYL